MLPIGDTHIFMNTQEFQLFDKTEFNYNIATIIQYRNQLKMLQNAHSVNHKKQSYINIIYIM